MTLHIYTPNQCPYQVSTSYTLQLLRYSPDKILKVKVTTARSKVKSRSDHDVPHLQPLNNVPAKYQLPTPYGCRDIARTRFSNSRSLQHGQRLNQGQTMTLHTYTLQPMSLPSMNFLHLTVSEIQPGQTFPPARPTTHPDTMGENNTPTALKGCGVKNVKAFRCTNLAWPYRRAKRSKLIPQEKL